MPLRMESDPPPVVPEIPKYPGLGQESAFRAAALMLKARAGDADLVVPDGRERDMKRHLRGSVLYFRMCFTFASAGVFFPTTRRIRDVF